ncbi:krab-a domain-containing [Labeo rohita]|nr:krab-a domain-containing [Labeo rohita]
MSVNEVRQFVGLASYYRRFVKDFATVAKPLHNLLRKHARFHWTPESQQAFDKLKELLTTAPILGYPMDSGDLILDTDASNFGIGAVLSQLQQGE